VALPLGGFRPLELSCGCLCDACAVELAAGAPAEYSVETGRLYCPPCAAEAKAVERARAAAGGAGPAGGDDDGGDDDEGEGDAERAAAGEGGA
jgi:hypothetical protein